jgi:hypothetical protein
MAKWLNEEVDERAWCLSLGQSTTLPLDHIATGSLVFGAEMDSTGSGTLVVARPGACWPGKKYAKNNC